MKKIAVAILLLATPACAADDAKSPKIEAAGSPTPLASKKPEMPKPTCGKDAAECQTVVNAIAVQANKWQAAAAKYRILLQEADDKVAQAAIDATN